MLTPWKKSYGQPRQHIKKLRNYFANKVNLVKAMVFPVVVYGCENWTIKKAEHWRIADFELWCWRKLLRVPWTARRSKEVQGLQEVHPKGNQSWIFIGRTEDEAETPIPWPPDAKNWLIWKDPDSGKDWRQEEKGMNRGWNGWMASSTQWTWVWASSWSWWWTGKLGVLLSMGSQRVKMTEQLNWTELTPITRVEPPKGPTSKYRHIWGLGFQHMNFEVRSSFSL